MMNKNQDYIVEQLRGQGLSDKEIQARLQLWEKSRNCGGSYDAILGTYARIPLPDEVLDIESRPVPTKTVGEATESGMMQRSFLPINQYGSLAQKVIKTYSEALQVNPDLMAATMLMGVAAAADKKMVVVHGNYTNRACLWLCVVAVSGYNKTSSMDRILKPLEAINEELDNNYRRTYSEWKKNGEQGTPPEKKQLILSDSTPEARDELLKNCGVLIYRDEIYGMFKDLNRYNQSGEQENYLSIWSGKSYAVNRKTTSSFYVKDPFLCVCGGIQPDVMHDAFGGKAFEASGFLVRWLFLWLDDAKVPDSINEDIIDKQIEGEWYTFIQNLWRVSSREFRLDPNAANVYQGYMKKTADTMNSEGCESNVRAMLAKLRIYALRLALVIHILRNGVKAPDLIDRHTMSAAVRTCDCFEYWGRRTLDEISDKDLGKRLSNSELLRELVSRYSINNQSELARLIGKSQQYVSGVLNGKK